MATRLLGVVMVIVFPFVAALAVPAFSLLPKNKIKKEAWGGRPWGGGEGAKLLKI